LPSNKYLDLCFSKASYFLSYPQKIIMNKIEDIWDSGNNYECFMGRWSKLMALEFLRWLNLPHNLRWLDIGCGTGALSEMIYKHSKPSQLTCIDPTADFLAQTKEKLNNRGEFFVGSANDIPKEDNSVDVVVSGLALNFFPELDSALTEMKRISIPGGLIAAYVWDYSDRMDLLRYFWDAVMLMDPNSRELDEGIRFPICNLDNLNNTFEKASLKEVEVTKLDIATRFEDFNDYWNPFLGGQGPAPGYLASLSKQSQEILKKEIYNNLPIEPDGSIELLCRAFAVKGKL
jgi:ubiquinone/menaquinone biosynthesis C-methylase UbiE